MAAKLYTSESYMRKRYVMDKKTPEEIAKECGVSLETIYSVPCQVWTKKE